MLLVELTINSVLFRISEEGIALTNWWDNKIISFGTPQLRTAKNTGGYAKMVFGSMTLSPDLFTGDWPPPFSCPVVVKYTGTTEAAAETLFTGTCHLSNLTRIGVTYDFYGDTDTTIVDSGESFNDTLDDVATWFCGINYLNLTLDTTYSRATSPTVVYTTTSDLAALDLLSDICAFFCHCFYIVGGTLYLVDMFLDNTTRAITEFDFMPSNYFTAPPCGAALASNYLRVSSYLYGTFNSYTAYCTVQAQIETALDNIILILNKTRCRLRVPFVGDLPLIGEKISWTDTSLGVDTDAYIRCRAIQYDFDEEVIIIEGEGVLA